MEIPDLYKTLMNDPAYKKLIKSAPENDKPRIEAAMKKFLDDFTNNVFNPLKLAMSDKDASKKIVDELKKKEVSRDDVRVKNFGKS